MTYATTQALIDRFGETELIQLTDRANTNAIDANVIARALTDADAEINGYLQGRYTLPLASVPEILITYACDIARYRLYDERASEQVTKRYDDAIKFLKLVAAGTVSLGLDSGGAPITIAGGPAAAGDCPVFTRESLRDYTG